MTWTWAAVIRAVALTAVVVMFVTDFGLNLWAKEIPTWVYYGLVALALGIDAGWLRDLLKAAATRSLGVQDRRDEP